MLDRAPRQDDGRSEATRCPRPGSRRPCRRTATTRRSTASSTSIVAHYKTLADDGRHGRRPEDPRAHHRQRRARRAGRRHLGPGARLVEQAGAGRRRREPDVGSQHERDLRRHRRPARRSIPRSASTIRRSSPEGAAGGSAAADRIRKRTTMLAMNAAKPAPACVAGCRGPGARRRARPDADRGDDQQREQVHVSRPRMAASRDVPSRPGIADEPGIAMIGADPASPSRRPAGSAGRRASAAARERRAADAHQRRDEADREGRRLEPRRIGGRSVGQAASRRGRAPS